MNAKESLVKMKQKTKNEAKNEPKDEVTLSEKNEYQQVLLPEANR